MTNEELTLVWQLGNQSQKSRAFAKVLKKNQGLVNKAFNNMFRKHSNMGLMLETHKDDFQQVASLKVMEALDTFDIHQGYRFSTWLAYRLKSAMNVYFRKHMHTVHEKAPIVTSLNVPIDLDNQTVEPIDLLEAEVVEYACESDKQYIEWLKSTLSDKEGDLLAEYYSDLKPSLKSIGEKLDVSRERIRQVNTSSIKKMKRFYKQQVSCMNPTAREMKEIYTPKEK